MNPKIVLVAMGSAVFAAGLTYWALAPIRSGSSSVAVAKVTPPPPGPPLVISTAGPEAMPPSKASPAPSTPSAPLQPPIGTKPSPAGEPVAALPAPAEVPVEKKEDPPSLAPQQAEPPQAPAEPPPAPVQTPMQHVPSNQYGAPATAPPQRVPLNPPKEADRVEPAVLRERESSVPNTATIAQGTLVIVRLGESLSSQKNLTGDTFFATLDQPLVAGGFVIAEKGARVEGKLIEVDKAKGLTGTSRISLALTQVNTTDGQRIQLQTSTFSKDGGERNRDHDAAKVGGGAIAGAVIGAAAGGGKGAAIGAGAGAAAGVGAVLVSGGRNLNIPVETKLTFRIEKPVTITERVVQ